jgi:hypothetical protein
MKKNIMKAFNIVALLFISTLFIQTLKDNSFELQTLLLSLLFLMSCIVIKQNYNYLKNKN